MAPAPRPGKITLAACGINHLIDRWNGDPDKEPSTEHTRRVYFHLIDERYGEPLPVLLITNSQERQL